MRTTKEHKTARTIIEQAGNWSRKAEILYVKAGLESTQWTLGVMEELTDPLKEQVNALSKKCQMPNPFFETAILSASVSHLGAVDKGFLFLSQRIGQEETLKFFCPVHRDKMGIFGVPVLRAWNHLYGPLDSPLIDDGCPETNDVLIESLQHMESNRAAALLFEFLPKTTHFSKNLFRATKLSQSLFRFSYRERASLSPMGKLYYLKDKLSGKRKQRLAKGMERLSESGKVTMEVATSQKDIMLRFEEFLLLEARSWKGRQGTSLNTLRKTAAFARQCVHNMSKLNRCTIYSLRLDNRSVASLVMFHSNGYYYPWKIAYDQTYSKYSVGNNLLIRVNDEVTKTKNFKHLDSLAAEDNQNANHFWTDRLPLQSMIISLGEDSNRTSAWLARELDFRFRVKTKIKKFLKAS